MIDFTRRNRNIGTSKQGHGQNNKFKISEPAFINKNFYERLENYVKIEKTINDHNFLFVIEKTRISGNHACTVNDTINILKHIPTQDLGNLQLIIFRQPKRKEQQIYPSWGRLVYSFEFEHDYYPAIIIEAVDYQKKLIILKKFTVEEQKEFERLKNDGHNFIEDKRYFISDYNLNNVRNTQLYRTLLHEIGHYVHYLNYVERSAKDNGDLENWDERFELYFKIPQVEKENFAHQYADKLKQQLIEKHIIPFDRID